VNRPERQLCWTLAALLLAAGPVACRPEREGRHAPPPGAQEARVGAATRAEGGAGAPARPGYTGSAECKSCHERFYALWAPSRHGLAMRPYTPTLARDHLRPQEADIVIGAFRYRAEIGPEAGWVLEIGPEGERRYPIVHVLGGKNVCYFLTPLDKGRYQTLPVAYDVRRQAWFDTAASGVRHFPGGQEDAAVGWKEWHYTFNTACYGCHVSQLSTRYDPETDTYDTTWGEPGINCEACHGPGEEHVKACRSAAPGQAPEDMKLRVITRRSGYTAHQVDASCAPCHAKGIPLTPAHVPGDDYFDHYDLVGLESPDFYADGRDLGENYTYTLWRLSPCVQAGALDCLHCHTSSGRFRQAEDPNRACLPCHAERVRRPAEHTRHPEDSPGSRCIACHMPATEFARMRRSDHSLRPPTPAATRVFGSPNACNLCHTDRDAAWADREVRAWHARDYQAPVLERARLVDAARRQDRATLPAILSYLERPDREEITSASLIRLLGPFQTPSADPVIRGALKDPSPLVRASAASNLASHPTPENVRALASAVEDPVRLVRVRAAMGLATLPDLPLQAPAGSPMERALGEALASITSRPDHWTSQYNLGNFLLGRGDVDAALAAYRKAAALDPRNPLPLVNGAMVHARRGDPAQAERWLLQALNAEPENAAAHFNLGLLRAEQGDREGAEAHLRAALRGDPRMAEAAYNLGVLLAGARPAEGLAWLEQAYRLEPCPKFGYGLAYYLREQGDARGAAALLEGLLDRWPSHVGAALLLCDLCEGGEAGADRVRAVLVRCLGQEGLTGRQRAQLEARLARLPAAAAASR